MAGNINSGDSALPTRRTKGPMGGEFHYVGDSGVTFEILPTKWKGKRVVTVRGEVVVRVPAGVTVKVEKGTVRRPEMYVERDGGDGGGVTVAVLVLPPQGWRYQLQEGLF